jgi:hypothetical protein
VRGFFVMAPSHRHASQRHRPTLWPIRGEPHARRGSPLETLRRQLGISAALNVRRFRGARVRIMG